MRMPRCSNVSTTLPGIARHMSFSFAQTLVRDHGLPQREAAVVCRNLGVHKNAKAATPQLYHRSTKKVQVLETAAAQADPAVVRANIAAHLPDSRAQRVMKARGDFSHAPAPGNILHYLQDGRPKVENARLIPLDREVVALIDSPFCRS